MKFSILFLCFISAASSNYDYLSPVPNNCTLYRKIYGRNVVTSSCSPGFHFSPTQFTCLPPAEAKCDPDHLDNPRILAGQVHCIECGVENPEFILLGEYNGKKYYASINDIVGWAAARPICQSHGYELASFETLNEANALINMCKNDNNCPTYALIDGMKQGSDWILSVSGKKIDYQLPWDPDQPSGINENYLCLSKNGLHDVSLQNFQKILCECL